MKKILIALCFVSLISEAQNVTTNSGDLQKQLIEGLSGPNIEFAPSISADGKTIVLQREGKRGSYQLYESRMDEIGNWSEPSYITAINDFGRKTDFLAGPNMSYDGNVLYYTAFFEFQSESEDIFYSIRSGDQWSEPIEIGDPINTDDFEGFPSISSDGKTLFFIRINTDNPTDEETGEPCFKIMSSARDGEGNWSEPVELGSPINLDCEHAPRIMADNRTLIFSSIRAGGTGGFDLYQSQLSDDGSWTEPMALTYVNSPESDQFPSISAAGDKMYYQSDDDIYSVHIPPRFRQNHNITVQGYIKNALTKNAVEAKLLIKDADEGTVLSELSNNPSDGWYSLVLTAGHTYTVEFTNDDLETHTLNYDLTKLEEYREEDIDIMLKSSTIYTFELVDADLSTSAGAKVKIVDASGLEVYSQIIDSTKSAFSVNLLNGTVYRFSAENENYGSFRLDIATTSNEKYGKRDQIVALVPKKMQVMLGTRDLTTSGKIKARLRIKNKNRIEVIEADANSSVALRVGDRYEIEATSESGYFFSTQEITVGSGNSEGPSGTSGEEFNMSMVPIIENVNLVLDGVLFETNSAEVTESSERELQMITRLLLDNPEMVIEISAHTDDVGGNEANMALSELRAQSVINYLTTNQIPAGQLQSKGRGETMPVVPNDSDENRAKNRRVELLVVSLDHK